MIVDMKDTCNGLLENADVEECVSEFLAILGTLWYNKLWI